METVYAERARVFKALCDARRQRILELLHGGEKCACVLIDEMSMPQSSLSYHMKILCDSGIVRGRREGKWVHYSIDPAGADRARQLLEQQITTASSCGGQAEDCCCGSTKAG